MGGYNKNVCKYVRETRNFAKTVEGSMVTFVSNNAYENTPESLGECFERNAEGMLKNMAIHELALLVSFYDVSVDNIESVTVDKGFSSMQTLPGPSGEEWTDFDKIKFTIKTKNGNKVSVAADRCGGTDSTPLCLMQMARRSSGTTCLMTMTRTTSRSLRQNTPLPCRTSSRRILITSQSRNALQSTPSTENRPRVLLHSILPSKH